MFKKSILCGVVGLLFLTACSGGEGGHPLNVGGNTQYTSTSLDGTVSVSGLHSQALTSKEAVVSGNNTFITPSNITGEALHLSYVIADQEREGVSVFSASSHGGPENASADIDLIAFDFSDPLEINSSIYIQDGFQGGSIDHMVASFGSMDIDFYVGDTLKQVRIAMVSRNNMVRGDVLFKVGDDYSWLDLDLEEFTTTRPDNPKIIEDIRDYHDDNLPNMLFYSLDIDLISTASLYGIDISSESTITSVIDFYVTNFVVIEDETDVDSLTDVELITQLSIRPCVYIDRYTSGVTASVNITVE